jgi:small subunit ribosomal protein S16
MGRKKKAYFRVIATDSRSPRDGRFIEILGHYHPLNNPATLEVKEERVFFWLGNGAIPTETVNALFKQIGLYRKLEKMQKGEDVSQLEILTQIKERKKKRKKRKAAKLEEKKPEEKEVEETKSEQKETEENSSGKEDATSEKPSS